MRVLVFGGRDYKDAATLNRVLDALHAEYGFTLLIEGEARGADRLAAFWASIRAVPLDPYPADWVRYGPAAGPIRNAEMLERGRPELGVGFPGKTGTADMAAKLKRAGVKLIEVDAHGRTSIA